MNTLGILCSWVTKWKASLRKYDSVADSKRSGRQKVFRIGGGPDKIEYCGIDKLEMLQKYWKMLK